MKELRQEEDPRQITPQVTPSSLHVQDKEAEHHQDHECQGDQKDQDQDRPSCPMLRSNQVKINKNVQETQDQDRDQKDVSPDPDQDQDWLTPRRQRSQDQDQEWETPPSSRVHRDKVRIENQDLKRSSTSNQDNVGLLVGKSTDNDKRKVEDKELKAVLKSEWSKIFNIDKTKVKSDQKQSDKKNKTKVNTAKTVNTDKTDKT